jgi:hypothetical protein
VNRDNNFGASSVAVQIFFLAYECQSCKSFPEVFMIRREKMKLTPSGRTPIEKVEIPKFIPKAQREFFSDAIIAFNSGQILAGKFLLRTFVEQYVRDFMNAKPPKIQMSYLRNIAQLYLMISNSVFRLW